MAKIVCKKCFLFEVEIKKNVIETVVHVPFLDLLPQD